MIFSRCRTTLKYRLRDADDHRHRMVVACCVTFVAGFSSLDTPAIIAPVALDRVRAEWKDRVERKHATNESVKPHVQFQAADIEMNDCKKG